MTNLNVVFSLSNTMNYRAILGISLAAVFAISMIMLPAYAGGHAVVTSATAEQKGGSLKLSVTAGADIPRFPDALANSVLVFGYAWADLDTGDVVLATIHPTIGRDSHQNPDAWHPHPGVLGLGEDQGSSSDFCVLSLGTAQGGIKIKGDTLNLNIASNQAGVSVDDLDGAVGFVVVADGDCGSTLVVNVTAAPVEFS